MTRPELHRMATIGEIGTTTTKMKTSRSGTGLVNMAATTRTGTTRERMDENNGTTTKSKTRTCADHIRRQRCQIRAIRAPRKVPGRRRSAALPRRRVKRGNNIILPGKAAAGMDRMAAPVRAVRQGRRRQKEKHRITALGRGPQLTPPRQRVFIPLRRVEPRIIKRARRRPKRGTRAAEGNGGPIRTGLQSRRAKT